MNEQKLRADLQAQYIAGLVEENIHDIKKYYCEVSEEDFLVIEKLKNRNISFCSRNGCNAILSPDQIYPLIIDLLNMLKEERT